jgi:hypothetical protein
VRRDRRAIGDAVEEELARWSEAFDGLVEARAPGRLRGECDGCGAAATVYALAAAVTGDDDGPWLCRPCAILGGIRVVAGESPAF